MIKGLTEEMLKKIPPLRATEEEPDPVVHIKIVNLLAGWEWYPLEFDGKDLFFGLVSGFEVELGYFTKSEMEKVKRMQVDESFNAKPLSAVRRNVKRQLGGF